MFNSDSELASVASEAWKEWVRRVRMAQGAQPAIIFVLRAASETLAAVADAGRTVV